MIGPSGTISCAMHMTDGLLFIATQRGFKHITDVTGDFFGYAELLNDLGSYAQMCNDFYKTRIQSREAPGVYDYEVSCEFGEWYGNYLIDHRCLPPRGDAEKVLDGLADAFWNNALVNTHH